MSQDYARATNAPRPVTIDGRPYFAAKIGPADFGELQAWIKSQIPDPRKLAAECMRGQSDAIAREIWAEACAEPYPPPMESPAVKELLSSPEGVARMVWIALRRHNQELDLDAARSLAERITLDEFAELQAAISPGEIGDPKFPQPTAPTPAG